MLQDSPLPKRRKQIKFCRFLFLCPQPYFTCHHVRHLFQQQGVPVLFTNMKFSIIPTTLNNVVQPTDLTETYEALRIHYLEKRISMKCYVEVEEHLVPLLKQFEKSITLLPPVEELFSALKTIGFDWRPIFTNHILPFFHSPPPLVSNLHRNNSYNLLGLELLGGEKFCFAPFQNHFYLNKFAVTINASNLLHMKEAWTNCKELGRIAVKRDGMNLQHLSKQLRNDREIVQMAISNNFKAAFFASVELQRDKTINDLKAWNKYLLQSTSFSSITLKNAPEGLRGDKELVKAMLEKNTDNLLYAPEELKRDKELVLYAVNIHGPCLCFADKTLQQDIEIVKAALSNNIAVFNNLLPEVKMNKEVVLLAVQHNAQFFPSLPAVMRGDKEIAMIAVIADGHLFDFVSPELKEDKDIILTALETAPYLFLNASPLVKSDRNCVLKAVSKDGLLLKFVCTSLKDDEEVVTTAVLQNAKAREYMGSNIRQDKRILMHLMSICSEITLVPIHEELRKDKEFMQAYRAAALKLMSCNGAMIMSIDKSLRRDPVFMRAAVAQNADNLRLVSSALKEDFEFVWDAVQRDGCVIQYASEILKQNPVLITAAKESILAKLSTDYDRNQLSSIPSMLFDNDKEFCLSVVRKDGIYLKNINKPLCEDKEINIEAVSSNQSAIEFASHTLKQNPQFYTELVAKNPMNLSIAPLHIRSNYDIVLKAVSKNGYAIQFATLDLQQNNRIISCAKRSIIDNISDYTHENRFNNLPSSFMTDKSFILDVVRRDAYQIEHVPVQFQNENEILEIREAYDLELALLMS